ncbi:MAG: DUF302 domain-containing protein [Cellulomonas sp.]
MSAPDGLVTQQCTGTVADVLARLRGQLTRREIQLFAVIDHGRAASDAGLELPDEVVAVFGNPVAGTRLMQRNPRVGIDLPLRVLIWDDEGTTTAAFTPPAAIAHRFSLDGGSLLLHPLDTLLHEITTSISG